MTTTIDLSTVTEAVTLELATVSQVVTLTVSENNPSGGGSVTSVNGQTGVVVLDADDISDTATTNKFTTAADIAKLAGIESGAQVNVATDLSYTASTRVLASSTGNDATLSLVDGTNPGLMSSSDFTKLGGIAAGAQVNTVTSVAGKTGAITLFNTDISGLGTAATLNVGTAANNVVQLDGTGRLPAVDGSQLTNLPAGFADPMTTRGDIIVRDATNTTARLGVGTSGQVLTSDGTDISWATPSSGFADPMTTAGDIIIRNGSNVTTRLGVGTEGQVLTVSSGVPAWAAAGGGGLSNPVAYITQSIQTVTYNDGGTSTLDNSTHNAFSLTANGTSTTIAHSNVPATGTRYGFELHLTWTSGTITWPTSWTKGDAAPTTTGNYVITGVTIDGGTSWKIAVLAE